MEIVIGIVVIFVLLIVVGKMKGAPEPTTMSDAAIYQRIQTETAWIAKYLSQPLATQQSESLRRMYIEKTAYIESLRKQLAERQMARHAHAVGAELEPILNRAAELVKEGMPEAEAQVLAIKEWSSKTQ